MEVNNKKLQNIAYKCTAKVLKNYHLYVKFRCLLAYGLNSRKSLYDSFPFSRNRKYNISLRIPCKSIDKLFSVIAELEGNMHYPQMKVASISNNSTNLEIQNCLTYYINNILHFYVEPIVTDPRSMMETLGRSIFQMACEITFGKDFIDETESHVPQEIRDMMENGDIPTKLKNMLEKFRQYQLNRQNSNVRQNSMDTWYDLVMDNELF